MAKKKTLTLKQTLPWILLIGGALGVLFAGILMAEKVQLLKNPNTQLACDMNPIVACGSVIDTAQASAFGFPNPVIGLVGFGAVATIGACLLAGATFRRWFWLGLQAGVIFGVGFVTWLQFQSIYRIGALCPFCMGVWTVMIPIFLYTTLYNLREGNIRVKKGWQQTASNFAQKHHGEILVVWYLLIFMAITTHFWYYWKTVI